MTGYKNGKAANGAAVANGNGNGGASILLVGTACEAEDAVRSAMPAMNVVHASDWFDALARLQHKTFAAVLAPAADVHRRPEAALRRMRESAGPAKLLLLALPEHEVLMRKLVAADVGCDDYLISPVTSAELVRTFRNGTHASPAVHAEEVRPAPVQAVAVQAVAVARPAAATAVSADSAFTMAGLAVAEVVLDAIWREPADAARFAIQELNTKLPWTAKLELHDAADRDPPVPAGKVMLSRLLPRVRPAARPGAMAVEDAPRVLHLTMDRSLDEAAAQSLLDQIAPQIGRALELQDRHARLQKIAITDELTGLYNCRYFKHALERILAMSKENRTPVTLLMFDIDNFKKYNDTYGHGAGDEILRQTGKMMRRCVRDHDVVARLGGDEFAVVFWEKDGPRTPITGKDGKVAPPPGRPPQSPVVVFQRFKRLIAGHDFEALGPTGKGQLTISGGLAVYPYDANTPETLICAADKALMFGAKKSGKNTVHLVGTDDPIPAE